MGRGRQRDRDRQRERVRVRRGGGTCAQEALKSGKLAEHNARLNTQLKNLQVRNPPSSLSLVKTQLNNLQAPPSSFSLSLPPSSPSVPPCFHLSLPPCLFFFISSLSESPLTLSPPSGQYRALYLPPPSLLPAITPTPSYYPDTLFYPPSRFYSH